MLGRIKFQQFNLEKQDGGILRHSLGQVSLHIRRHKTKLDYLLERYLKDLITSREF